MSPRDPSVYVRAVDGDGVPLTSVKRAPTLRLVVIDGHAVVVPDHTVRLECLRSGQACNAVLEDTNGDRVGGFKLDPFKMRKGDSIEFNMKLEMRA